MPALTSFVWRPSLNGPALPINFLRHNPQLELLSLDNCSSYDIDQVVLPLLVSRFDRLKFLELVYAEECTEMTKAALSYISCLKSLTQLHLQLGFPVGWRRTWLVKHRAVQEAVRHLPNLKILALSRDTYDAEQTGEHEKYYEGVSPCPMDYTEAQLYNNLLVDQGHNMEDKVWEARRKFVFEMIHRRRMLQHGYTYCNLWYSEGGPKLEFIYIGEIPMRVKQGWFYGPRAIAVTEKRDGLYTFLQRTFKKVDDSFAGD